MTNNRKRITAGMVSLLLGLGAGGAAVGAAVDNLTSGAESGKSGQEVAMAEIDFSRGPVQCQILADAENGSLTLQSVVHSQISVNGSYTLKIVSVGGPNRSNMSQGGNFVTDENNAIVLGRLMLGGNGSTYDVNLKVTANGRTVECAERVKA